ncbi:ESF1 homolog [Vespa velutina]|uniref:ESF1 homolog n=1 Tax=Vespa velutina TaxID=202808 RepID=UPI001FB48EA7|nr:ESF1 homolog [Vespa velutina]XP_047359853.1 ESF1 homolog [Vespa velutina]
MDESITDKRFAHITRDPKFRRIPKIERKIKIDKRFQSMFKDKKFAIKYTIDKRGKPINQTSMENLRKYYELTSSEDESIPETNSKIKKARKKRILKHNNKEVKDEIIDNVIQKKENDSDECISDQDNFLGIKPKGDTSIDTDTDSSLDAIDLDSDLKENEKQLHVKNKDENIKLTDQIKERLQDLSVNYARGEGVLLTDSSSDEESSEYSDENEDIEHGWGELDKDAERTEQSTHRLAICNMDWDRIRAVDLMVLFNSFLPSGGLIHCITIYPSEFGLQRMKEEEIKGPVELVNNKTEEVHSKSDNEEGSDYHMEKLRRYQLNRLKYYYAVLECDSVETANKIYTECDGIEYESTATKLDLRFIPNDMTFDQEPREVCTELPELSKYQPRQFTTTALQQVKVELTWDETNLEREEIANKLNSGKINELNENDLQAYLANATSDDDTDNESGQNNAHKTENQDDPNKPNDPIEKYKTLLKQLDKDEEAKKKKDVELEFTWGIGTKNKTEKLVKEKLNKKEDLTPFEEYLAKRKAKQKARKEELKKFKELRDDDILNSEDSDVDSSKDNKLRNDQLRYKKQKIAEENSDMDSSITDGETKRADELELLLMDETERENKKHFNMKKIEANADLSKSKRKRLKKKQNLQEIEKDDFEVNVKDTRFAALYTSHYFNIDPADPHYRKTKGTEALIQEKLKRRAEDTPVNETEDNGKKLSKISKKLDVELQALVKSVKRNTKTISQPIK